MAAAEDLGELVNNPMTTTEAEDPLSKTPASVQPDKNSLAQTHSSPSARKARDRKQVDFFAPDDVKVPEKLVVKEVHILYFFLVERAARHEQPLARALPVPFSSILGLFASAISITTSDQADGSSMA